MGDDKLAIEIKRVVRGSRWTWWEWRIARAGEDGSLGETVAINTFLLQGRTQTKWAARREARRALRSLRRYQDGGQPEVIYFVNRARFETLRNAVSRFLPALAQEASDA
jgi:hypothetical protein